MYSQRGFEASLHHADEIELFFTAPPWDDGRVWAPGAGHDLAGAIYQTWNNQQCSSAALGDLHLQCFVGS